MDDALVMDALEGETGLDEELPNSGLSDGVLGACPQKVVIEISLFTVLHDDVEFTLYSEGVDILDYIRVGDVFEQLHFLLAARESVLIVNLDLLHY